MKTMSWKLKDILMIAVCAVLFGVIFLGATYAGGFLAGLFSGSCRIDADG